MDAIVRDIRAGIEFEAKGKYARAEGLLTRALRTIKDNRELWESFDRREIARTVTRIQRPVSPAGGPHADSNATERCTVRDHSAKGTVTAAEDARSGSVSP